LSAALRARGYWVVDVPLGLLAGRVAVQRPALVVLDADTAGTAEAVERMRATSGDKPIDIVLIADLGTTSSENRSELEQRAVGLFTRPINVDELVTKIEQLIGPPGHRSELPSGSAARSPVLVAAARRPYRYEGGKARPLSGAPPPATTSAAPQSVPAAPSVSPSQSPSGPPSSAGRPSSQPPGGRAGSVVPQAIGAVPHARLSPELELLLGRAEQRVRNHASVPQPVERLSPDAEVDAVLPADLLAALDEPIQADDDDDDDDSVAGTAGTGGGSDTGSRGSRGATPAGTVTGARSASTKDTGSDLSRPDAVPELPPPEPSAPEFGNEAPTLPPARPLPSQPLSAKATTALDSLEPPLDSHPSRLSLPSDVPPSRAEETISTRPPRVEQPPPTAPGNSAPERERVPTYAQPPPPSAPLESRGALPDIPVSLGPGGGLRALARCVAARYTGAMALEDSAGIRRVVFRDGDFVTAASSAESETLVAFLVQRGDLPGDGAQRVARRVPPFGRHAGAALVAQGHLRQDELWPVLRAHAEWLLGKIMDLASGAAGLEREVPQRLQAEPGVFGGATGAEVLLEMIRRTVKPSDAVARLGGRDALLATGGARSLLAECALSEADQTLASQADGMSVGELLARAGNDDFACVLLALVELGVLHVQGLSKRAVVREQAAPAGFDPIDAEALRQRVATRRALVEESDYFALLGVARDATSYDLRRAYQALRKDLDPERVLTAATVDLREEVDGILEVIDEAYDILRDPVRRERYRRALERAPD
jgi:hypothetical protein